MIREWIWNEHGSSSDGVTLYSDRVNFWSVDWKFPYGDVGREMSIDEFLSEGSSMNVPPDIWKELNEEVSKLKI